MTKDATAELSRDPTLAEKVNDALTNGTTVYCSLDLNEAMALMREVQPEIINLGDGDGSGGLEITVDYTRKIRANRL